MKVFIYGGPQSICHICTRRLLSEGHETAVFLEKEEDRTPFQGLGADLFAGSIFQLPELDTALSGCDVAVFLGTDMPEKSKPAMHDLHYYDRVRRDGTRNFLSAVLRQKVPFSVIVSSTPVYGDHGTQWVEESHPLHPAPPAQSFADMEEIVSQRDEFQGVNYVILRAGIYYSAHTFYMQNLFSMIQKGKTPPLAGQRGFVSLIHAEDFADALLCAITNGPSGEVFNIVDDTPIPMNKLISHMAAHIDGKAPGGMPSFLLRLAIGKEFAKLLQSSCRVSNQKAKKILGWSPRYPSIYERLPHEVAIWKQSHA